MKKAEKNFNRTFLFIILVSAVFLFIMISVGGVRASVSNSYDPTTGEYTSAAPNTPGEEDPTTPTENMPSSTNGVEVSEGSTRGSSEDSIGDGSGNYVWCNTCQQYVKSIGNDIELNFKSGSKVTVTNGMIDLGAVGLADYSVVKKNSSITGNAIIGSVDAAGGGETGTSCGGGGGGGGLDSQGLSAISSILTMTSSALSTITTKLTEKGANTKSTTELRANGDEWFANQDGTDAEVESGDAEDSQTGDEVCDYVDQEVCENVTRKDCVGNESLGEIVNCTEKNVLECKTKSVCVLKDDALENNPLGLGEANEDAGTASKKTSSVTGNVVAASSTSAKEKFTISQNNPSKPVKSVYNSELSVKTRNGIIDYPGVVTIYTPDSPTTIINKPKSVGSGKGITGRAISEDVGNQYVKLLGKDLDMKAKDVDVVMHKPFTNVNGQGTNLNLTDGETTILFNGPKTLYPRKISCATQPIGNLENDLDLNENQYKLASGGVKGYYLVERKKIVSVGDDVVGNPLEGYEGIIIPGLREQMWKNAADELAK